MGKLTTTVFERHRKGDAWVGLTMGPILINSAQPAAAAASIKMQFRNKAGTLGYEFNETPGAGEGTFTMDNVDTWEFSILSQILDLEAGKWYWDIEITDVNGLPLTLAAGTIRIDPDITHV